MRLGVSDGFAVAGDRESQRLRRGTEVCDRQTGVQRSPSQRLAAEHERSDRVVGQWIARHERLDTPRHRRRKRPRAGIDHPAEPRVGSKPAQERAQRGLIGRRVGGMELLECGRRVGGAGERRTFAMRLRGGQIEVDLARAFPRERVLERSAREVEAGAPGLRRGLHRRRVIEHHRDRIARARDVRPRDRQHREPDDEHFDEEHPVRPRPSAEALPAPRSQRAKGQHTGDDDAARTLAHEVGQCERRDQREQVIKRAWIEESHHTVNALDRSRRSRAGRSRGNSGRWYRACSAGHGAGRMF